LHVKRDLFPQASVGCDRLADEVIAASEGG